MIVYSGSIEDSHEVIQFFRHEVDHLRPLRKVKISQDTTLVLDINKDGMEFPGLTFGSAVLERLLQELGVVFRTETLRRMAEAGKGTLAYDLSARYTWGHDRVL